MKKLASLLSIFCMVSSVSATIISADADGYSNGTDISGVFSGITLSSVGGYSGLDDKVYAWSDGLASTGTSVFANNLSFQRQWNADLRGGFALRADFGQLANQVSIDIIGDDEGDLGILSAYNSTGTLINTIVTPQLGTGQVYTATIDRGLTYDIAYIIAGGSSTTGDAVHLDNLTANVPEPITIFLLGAGSLFLVKNRRKTAKLA